MKQKLYVCLSLLLAAALAMGSLLTVSLAYPRLSEAASGALTRAVSVFSGTDAAAADATGTDATGTDATPTDATPTDATPTDATPTDATPSDAECAHERTVVKDADPEVCTKEHFTGRVYCAVCGKLLDEGAMAPAAGHRFRLLRQEADIVMREVVAVVKCDVCGLEKRIPLSEYNVTYRRGEKAYADGAYLIVTEGLTAADLLADCPEDAVVLGPDGSAVAADQLAGSGLTVLFPSSRRYVVVLYGDADGDGKITPEDARVALRRSVNLEEPLEWRDKACHVVDDGKRAVKPEDARQILRASVKLEDATRFGRRPGSEATPTDATPTDATPTDATPTDATPTDATPTDATPTDAAPQPGEYICIWKGGVNLRADHSLEALPLAVIRWGEAVTVTEVQEEDETGETVLWGKILYKELEGWSMLKYFKPGTDPGWGDD